MHAAPVMPALSAGACAQGNLKSDTTNTHAQVVNGPNHPGANGSAPAKFDPTPIALPPFVENSQVRGYVCVRADMCPRINGSLSCAQGFKAVEPVSTLTVYLVLFIFVHVCVCRQCVSTMPSACCTSKCRTSSSAAIKHALHVAPRAAHASVLLLARATLFGWWTAPQAACLPLLGVPALGTMSVLLLLLTAATLCGRCDKARGASATCHSVEGVSS